MEDFTSRSLGRARTVFTIGHSTRTFAELIALLREARIELLVDVRSIPRSRTNPQFNIDVLPGALAAAGLGFRHLPSLGGLRHRQKNTMASSNTLWRNTSFRNFADYAGTAAFRVGLQELEALARDKRCAIMCAEVRVVAVPPPNHSGLPAGRRDPSGAPNGTRQVRSREDDSRRSSATGWLVGVPGRRKRPLSLISATSLRGVVPQEN